MDISEKKKLQNDILLMAEIGRQYNLYDEKQAASVKLFMEKRQPLKSVRAESFLARVNLLAESDAPKECVCLLCGRNPAPTGVFCAVCAEAIERSVSADSAAADDGATSVAVGDETMEKVEGEALVETNDGTPAEDSDSASAPVDAPLAAKQAAAEASDSRDRADVIPDGAPVSEAEAEPGTEPEPESSLETEFDLELESELAPEPIPETENDAVSEPEIEPAPTAFLESAEEIDTTSPRESDIVALGEQGEPRATDTGSLDESEMKSADESSDIEGELSEDAFPASEGTQPGAEAAAEAELDEEPFVGDLDSLELPEEDVPRRSRPPIPLIIATIISVCLLFYVVIFYLLPRQGISLTEGFFSGNEVEIVTEEAGQEHLTQEYNESEYTTEYTETIKVPIGMYDVEVGEYCGDSWNTDLIDVMVYHVQNIDDPSLYARLMVAPDGRVIGTGTLVNPDEPLKAYRVQ